MIGFILSLVGLGAFVLAGLLLVSMLRSAMDEQQAWQWRRVRVPVTITVNDLRMAFDDLLLTASYEWWLVHQADHTTALVVYAHPLVLQNIEKAITSALPAVSFRVMNLAIPPVPWGIVRSDVDNPRPQTAHAVCVIGHQGKRSVAVTKTSGVEAWTIQSIPFARWLPWATIRILLRFWGHTHTELFPDTLDAGMAMPDLPSIPTHMPTVDGVVWQFGRDQHEYAVTLPLGTHLDVLGSDLNARRDALTHLLRQSVHHQASCVALLTPDHADAASQAVQQLGNRVRVVDYRVLATTTTIDCAAWLADEDLTILIATMAGLAASDPLWLTIAPTIQRWRTQPNANLATLCAALCTPAAGAGQAIDQRMTAQRWRTRLAHWFTVRWMGLFATPGDDIEAWLRCGGVVLVVLPPLPDAASMLQMILASAVQRWQARMERPIISISDVPWKTAIIQLGGQRAAREAWHLYVGGRTPRTALLRQWRYDPITLHDFTGSLLLAPHCVAHCVQPWRVATSESNKTAPESHTFWQCAPEALFQPAVELPKNAAGTRGASTPAAPIQAPSFARIPPTLAHLVPTPMTTAPIVPLSAEHMTTLISAMLADRRNGVSPKKAALLLSTSREQAELLLTELHARWPHIILKPTFGGLRIHADISDADVWEAIRPADGTKAPDDQPPGTLAQSAPQSKSDEITTLEEVLVP